MERQSSSRLVLPTEMAIREDNQHQAYCAKIAPHRWISRPSVDDKLNSIIQRGLEKSVCAHFYGGHGSGKTALICRLTELLQTKNCYVITRFAHLTDSAIFANELFKNIFLKVHFYLKKIMFKILILVMSTFSTRYSSIICLFSFKFCFITSKIAYG